MNTTPQLYQSGNSALMSKKKLLSYVPGKYLKIKQHLFIAGQINYYRKEIASFAEIIQKWNKRSLIYYWRRKYQSF